MHAPLPKCLAKVLIMLFKSPVRRRVEQTADTEYGADAETSEVAEAVAYLSLQRIIDDGNRIIDVRQKIRDAPTNRLRSGLDISACHWPEGWRGLARH